MEQAESTVWLVTMKLHHQLTRVTEDLGHFGDFKTILPQNLIWLQWPCMLVAQTGHSPCTDEDRSARVLGLAKASELGPHCNRTRSKS